MSGAEARLRAAAHRLDADVDLLTAHEQFLELERAYAERTASDEGIAALTAAARAVEEHALGEAAGRDGDDDLACAHLDRARRLGLPGLARPGRRRSWDDADLDTVADAAGEGDRAALESLLARLRPFLERYCRARLPCGRENGVDADDVVQEVLMAVLVQLPGRRTTSVTAFAVAVARRTLHGHARTAMRFEVDARLGELPLDERNVLVARVLTGRAVDETADLLDMPPGEVKAKQHRALSRLRLLMGAPAAQENGR